MFKPLNKNLNNSCKYWLDSWPKTPMIHHRPTVEACIGGTFISLLCMLFTDVCGVSGHYIL